MSDDEFVSNVLLEAERTYQRAMLYFRVVHRVNITLEIDFTPMETEEHSRLVKFLFWASKHGMLYKKHAIQMSTYLKDIIHLRDIVHEVTAQVNYGYDLLRDMFNLGYDRSKRELKEAENVFTTLDLIMLYRHKLIFLRARVQYFKDRLNEVDEKFDPIEKYGDETMPDKRRRLRYLARNHNFFLGVDHTERVNTQGDITILRYYMHYENTLFP